MKKRSIIILLVVLLTAILGLTGCGNKENVNGGGNNKSQNSSNNSNSATKHSLENINIEIDNKKIALPCTLQELLDFGFEFDNNDTKAMYAQSGGQYISDESRVKEKPFLNKGEQTDEEIRLYYKGNGLNGIKVKFANPFNDSQLSIYQCLTAGTVETDTIYTNKYSTATEISIGGIKQCMKLDDVKKIYEPKYENIAYDSTTELTYNQQQLKVNGRDIKEISIGARTPLKDQNSGIVGEMWVNIYYNM